jgi:L-ornithine N5-monooxygenase
LLEQIYGTIYKQRIRNEDETAWQHRILPFRSVTHVEDLSGTDRIRLHVRNDSHIYGERKGLRKESLDVDVVVAATGYIRDAHENMLRPAEFLRPDQDEREKKWTVSRDYRVMFKAGAVSDDAGVWLQGCNESTHGLSDTLLSILANRGGELVQSIFGRP